MTTKLKIPKIRFKEFSSEWEEKEFGNFVNKEKGKYNPKTSSENFTCIELESIEQNTGCLLNTFDSIKQESIKNTFKQGNVLYSKLRPYLNKYYYAKFDGVCSSEIWVLNGLKINNHFLYYIIQTSRFSKVANISFGSKMPRSDWDFVSGTPFGVPSLPEQQKIASFLSSVDEKIEKIKEKKKNLEEYKKGVMQKIFSQEMRFKDENGEEFGEWEEKKLGDCILDIADGGTPSTTNSNYFGGNINWVVIEDIKDKILKTKQTLTTEGFKACSSRLWKPGTIILSTGATIGNVGITYVETGTKQGICGIIVNEKTLNIFLKFWFQFNKNELLKKAQGSSIKEIRPPELKKLKINLPALKEQEKIADFLSGIDEKIEKVSDELRNYEEFKKGLLQGMFV